jgi:hypothetical protein
LKNLLEPRGLVDHFLQHPPLGFMASTSVHGVPVFEARFDLLTTADQPLRRNVQSLPFYSRWSRWLRPKTCFVGTTVTEFALLPDNVSAHDWVAALKSAYARAFPFLIVKDVPHDCPLLDAASNAANDAALAALGEAGFVVLEGQALAYVPINFDSVDAYLSRLSPGRRKNIRRKLRSRADLDVEVVSTGAPCFEDPSTLALFYRLYLNVYEQSELHFDLLSESFFQALLQAGDDGGVVFLYRQGGELIGYNICYVSQGRLIDKYIGLVYPQARHVNLYVVSWFQNLEYALSQGLTHYVAGWTDPQVKAELGASFTMTRHAVYVRSPLLRALLVRLARHFESDRAWRDAHHGE